MNTTLSNRAMNPDGKAIGYEDYDSLVNQLSFQDIFAVLFEASGDGSSISTIKLACFNGITVKITEGYLCDDAVGTNPSKSKTLIGTGADEYIYVKLESGNSIVTFNKKSDIKRFDGLQSNDGNMPIVKRLVTNYLPENLERLTSNNNGMEIMGDTKYLPVNMTVVQISDITVNMYGDIGNLPSGLVTLYINDNLVRSNSRSYVGDLANIPSTVNYCLIDSRGTRFIYTGGRTWASSMRYVKIVPSSYLVNNWTSTMIDDLLIDLANVTTWTNEQTIDLSSSNLPARTSASDVAVSTLQGNGVTVLTN